LLSLNIILISNKRNQALALFIIIILLALYQRLTSENEIEDEPAIFVFDSHIEGGSGKIIKRSNSSYSIIMDYDVVTKDNSGQEIGSEMYWWSFNITQGIKDKSIEFWVPQSFTQYDNNPIGSSIAPKLGQWPVFSEDNGKTWEYIDSKDITWIKPDTSGDKYYLKFNYTMNTESALLSVAFPYLYSNLETYANNIQGLNYVDVDSYNSSRDRRVYVITVSETKIIKDKPTIWIISGQEPSETWAQIISQGILEFLVSNNSEAIEYREQYNWKITPMINPDGNYLGKTQRNANNIDITKEWDEFGLETIEAEINGTLVAMDNWINNGNQLSLFIDLHTMYTHNWQVIYPSNRIVADIDEYKIQLITESIKNQTIWGYGRSFPWSNRQKSSQAVYLRYETPSLTLEGSQWQKYTISYPEEIASIEILKNKGRDLVRAIDYYFSILEH